MPSKRRESLDKFNQGFLLENLLIECNALIINTPRKSK